MTAANSEMLNSALALAKAGFQVFPLVYTTKVPPKGTRGLHDATSNAALIRHWFGGTHLRNLAVRTGAVSRFWVLDVDNPEALVALEASHGRLPLTRMCRTSQGFHYWWRLGSRQVPNSTSKIAPKIDARGEGGYVLAAPAVHPTGVIYEWANNAPLVEAPEWLVELAIRRPVVVETPPPLPTHYGPPAGCGGAYGRAALDREIAVLSGMSTGGRNHALNKSSFRLHQLVAAGVLDGREVKRRLVEACLANGLATDAKSGGMPQVLRTIMSGARAGLKHPRSVARGGA